jgi:tetratricopeptide (TPR) repeat protein
MTRDLLELALTDPAEAWAAAEHVVGTSADPRALSVAYQARGIVRRDAGHATEAIVELRVALRYAARVDAERVADVRATYGIALYLAGRTGAGLRALDQAVASTSGELQARVLMRRAWVLTSVGRYESALADMTLALHGIRGRGIPAWEARTLSTLGHIQSSLGLVRNAEESLAEAVQIFTSEGLAEEAAHALGNWGSAVVAGGDLPRALQIFSRVDPEHVSDSRLRMGIVASHCEAFLAAGLYAEAADTFERYLVDISLPEGARGELNLALANVRLAGRDPRAALAAATQARVAFHHQGSAWFELRARLVQARASYELGEMRGLARATQAVARRLDADRAVEAPAALVLAGRVARGPDSVKLWEAAAAYRDRPSALVRSSAWLGSALVSDADRNAVAVLRACERGLDALDEHRRTLGSSELRALATTHGRELAELALRHASTDGRRLLRWSERWRATALSEPPVTPDREVSAELAALRDNGRRLAQARADGDQTDQLVTERARLERAVRAEHHRRAGREHAADGRFEVERLVAEVGAGTLVELVDVDGALHVIVVHAGKVRRRVAGSAEDAWQLAEHARSALRRAGRGRPYDPGDLGVRLQQTLLGSAAALLPDGPVAISPTGRLHAVPWALLPTLADRPFSIVPSAAQWLRANAVRKPRKQKVLLLAAPGLGSGGSEVPLLTKRHAGATVLRGNKASVENAMAGLDGASLAHVAAHGLFRPDSPLFSSLEMADGPLSVYDLERLRRAPYRLVLSACESGVLAPVGADELLGLASALFSMGTAGLVCSIAEVNDDATAALMLDLHDHLVAHPRDGLGGALLTARRAARGDATREATAAAFLALGV